jgi:hypothetical protein
MTPCYLYLFEHYRAGVLLAAWRYTDAERDAVNLEGFEGLNWTSAPVSLSSVKHNAEPTSTTVEITCPADWPVVQMFLAGAPAGQVWATVWHYDAEGVAGLVWRGLVRAPEWSGGLAAKLNVGSLLARGERKGLRLTFSSACGKVLFGQDPPGLPGGGCGVDRAPWERSGSVLEISADGLTVRASLPDQSTNFFKLGFFEARGQSRMVLSSGEPAGGLPGQTLHLTSRIPGLVVGDPVVATKGCDRSKAACIGFGNVHRFGGHDTVPKKNPFEQPVNAIL